MRVAPRALSVDSALSGSHDAQTVQMFFLQYEARPCSEHPQHAEIGGATVNCWVRAETLVLADRVAREEVKGAGWEIECMERAIPITRETQLPEGLPYFEQAELDGAAFVFHSWPVEATEGGASDLP
jgi:hypothetical protein